MQTHLPGHSLCINSTINKKETLKNWQEGKNYLPKWVATINQFICSSLKSTLPTLSKCHPILDSSRHLIKQNNKNVHRNHQKGNAQQINAQAIQQNCSTSYIKPDNEITCTKHHKERQDCLTSKPAKSKRLTSFIRIIVANPQKVYLINK